MNNIGPSMDPCGTPYNIESESERHHLFIFPEKEQ